MILDLFVGRSLTFNSAELVSRFGLCVAQISKIKNRRKMWPSLPLVFLLIACARIISKFANSGDFLQFNFGSNSAFV